MQFCHCYYWGSYSGEGLHISDSLGKLLFSLTPTLLKDTAVLIASALSRKTLWVYTWEEMHILPFQVYMLHAALRCRPNQSSHKHVLSTYSWERRNGKIFLSWSSQIENTTESLFCSMMRIPTGLWKSEQMKGRPDETETYRMSSGNTEKRVWLERKNKRGAEKVLEG